MGGNLYLLCAIVSISVLQVKCVDNLRVAYKWKQIDFNYPSARLRQQAIDSKEFIPANVLPVGIEVYQSRLFVTLPRRRNGVPASLAYFDLNDNTTISPRLTPFPSWQAHRFSSDNPPEIVSPFRVRADKCGRLWVLDTGSANILGNITSIRPTTLLVYDLHNDKLLRRFQFAEGLLKQGTSFANIAVEDGDCTDTYAYCGDLGAPGLVVYSWKQQDAWRIHHDYFHPDPLAKNFSIDGINFQFNDGVFGLAISKAQANGFATLYFHPMSSFMEYSVSTMVLRNKAKATSNEIYKDFKTLGSRGPNAQAGTAFLDQSTGVLFYGVPNLNAIVCWKTTNHDYTIRSQGGVYMSSTNMIYPTDIKVDYQNRLWALSNRLPKYIYGELDRNDVNFRILTGHVREVIKNTACDTKTEEDLSDRLIFRD